MKKTSILMAAAALLFAGCAKEMESPIQETPLGMKTVTLKASYDADLTKTTYEGDKTLSWTTGDKIGVGVTVNGKIQTVAFELTDGAGSPSGTFTGEIPENGELTKTAFYPWNGEQSDNAATGGSNVGGDGNIYFHQFPETAWTEGSAPLLLAAKFDDPNAIVFKQAAGAMKVTLKEVPADADKLVLTVNGKEISGWFALNPANAGTDAITTANSGTGTSQLAYTFATADADRDMTFYFPLPAIELPSFNIELFAGNASLWSMASTKARTVTRGKILRMPELTVEVMDRTFFLVGNIGGSDYYGNDYKFDKEGKLEVTFPEGDNYVFVKRGNGGDGNNYYFSQYCTETTGTVWHYNDGQGEKMLVPGGKKLGFTLVDNGDNNSMTLSYKELALGLTRVWGFYKEGDTPWYATSNITGVTIANDGYGMARSLAMDDDYIYLPKSSAFANTAAVSIADKTVQKAISKSGISGGSYFVTSFVRMIKNTDASVNGGKDILLLCNLTDTDTDSHQLRLYAYKDGVDAPPTQIAGYCWDSANSVNDWRRYGDRFFVEGDWSSAKVYFPSFNANKTVVLSIANGARTAVTQIAAGSNSPEGIKDLTVYPGDNKLFLTNGSIANLVAPTGGLANGWNEYTLSASCSAALNTWGYNFFEFEGKNYIAYARITGENNTKARIEVVEDKGDLITSLTAQDGLMVSPIHDATDLDREVATGNLADCCVRVINGEVFIAALTRDGGFVLDKLEWK